MIKYSFIIPVKEINNYIRESVPKILEIKRDDYEIIIYPDEIDNGFNSPKTRQIASGKCGPAEKRSLAMNDANGEILIFVDDDAYPEKNILNLLDKDFEDNNIVAVGGPAITPSNDSFWQKVSGAVFLSYLSGGNPERYIPVGEKRFVDDWPSVNLSARKSSFITVNGFNSKYWPGEDILFCLNLLNKTNGKILYDPDLIVYHHRRSGLIRHLKQISQYGLHRGFFAKKYKGNSYKIKYFTPSVFLIFIIFGILFSPFFGTILLRLYSIGWLLYLLALIKAFLDIKKYEKDNLICLNAMYYTFFTHLVYGFYFLKGFFTKELVSQLRSDKLKN